MKNKIFLLLLFICFTTSAFSQMIGYQPRAFLPTRFVIDDRPATINSVINIMSEDSKQQKLMKASMNTKNLSSFMLLGGVAMMGSFFVDYTNRPKLPGRVFVSGLAVTILSIPTVGISNRLAGRSIDLHNGLINSLGNRPSYELNIHVKRNGFGVVMNW